MNDASIVLTRDGSGLGGGMVFTAKDRAAGERLLTTLRSYAVIAGGQGGVKVTDAPYAGATMTTVDFGDLRDLGPQVGAPSVPIQGHAEIAYASTADLIVVGVGDTFVKSVLDTKPGSSLADDGRFKAMLGRVGDRNVSAAFVDLGAVRELVESVASGQPGYGEYENNVKPYVTPLDAWVQATVIDGDLDRSTGVVVAK
jgi:hypothetical protein